MSKALLQEPSPRPRPRQTATGTKAGRTAAPLTVTVHDASGRVVAKNVSFGRPGDFDALFQVGALETIDIVKKGIPAKDVGNIANFMGMSTERLTSTLGIARATLDRKVQRNDSLSVPDSSRVVGLARLVGQVQAMVTQSGNPEGFDAGKWVAQWLERPLPAIGGKRPAELMDTSEGQALVVDVIARIQAGSFA